MAISQFQPKTKANSVIPTHSGIFVIFPAGRVSRTVRGMYFQVFVRLRVSSAVGYRIPASRGARGRSDDAQLGIGRWNFAPYVFRLERERRGGLPDGVVYGHDGEREEEEENEHAHLEFPKCP